MANTLVASAPSSEKPADRIGRYKLLQKIGEGGCGVVYMAQQEAPVRRQVALKIIKLGMDTRNVIARFEAERQALALMDHPNIAKVFDAGATEQGRPFFVMELVRGIRITSYCDENQLSTRQRLDLFIQVCQAIQHAHQKGVIHRDIKPSNILVTLRDGVPVPKVIDFGIAKATTDQLLTDKTVFTEYQQFLGTPAYMSPEQAEMSELGIDTRSDIYSLGILLYELLTSKTPFETKDLRGGLDEVRRIIREREPTRPSTRLRSLLEGELTSAARQRRIEPPALIRLLRGDLDWIVMKCLEKDRVRRYETANGLGNDVQRHLKCEPVVARPPSKLYEFQKTVRRHKFGFLAAGAVGTALCFGLGVSTWLLIREKATRRRAVAAEQAAELGLRAEATQRQRAEAAEGKATEELWRSYLAQAQAARYSSQPGRRFDSLGALTKAAAIRFSPELRDEAIACLALPVQRRIEANLGVFDYALERYACVLTNSGQISVRAASDDRELFRLPTAFGGSAPVKLGRFSHSGKFLPAWYANDFLRVWDLERRASVVDGRSTGQFQCVDFQPDDGRVAVPSAGWVSLYPLAPGGTRGGFPTLFDATSVRFDPSGHQLALSSGWDNRLVILDTDSGAVLQVLTNAERLNEVAWHPFSPILAAAGRDTGLINVWDTATGRQVYALKGRQSEPGNFAFSPDGDILISSGWDGTHLWHVRTGEHLMSCLNYGALESFGSSGGAYGHSVYRGLDLEMLSFASGRDARRLHASEANPAGTHVAFSADGRWLAFAAGEIVELIEARTARLLATLPAGRVHGACFAQNGDGLFLSGDEGLYRWPLRRGGAGNEWSVGPPEAVGPPGACQRADLSENGRVLAAYYGDHVRLFDVGSLGETARTGPCGNPGLDRYVSLSPDGSKLATGGWHEPVVTIWDAHTGRLVRQLTEPDSAPEATAYPVFDPNGRSLIILSWHNYRVWSTDSWVAGTPVPRSGMPIVALSHRSGLLATCDQGQTSIQLFDLATGHLLAKLQSPLANRLTGLVFSPDDSQIAVTHFATRELMVWDLRLLREELSNMGMDWARPPYPPAASAPPPEPARFRVLKFCDAPVTDRGLEAEVRVRTASGLAHAPHGHFAEAAADFARVTQLRPDDHEVWHWQAVALVQAGQLDAYRALCKQSLRRFAETTDPNTADRIAKDYLMLPGSGPDLAIAAKMAETAVSAPTNHPQLTWFRFVKGLAEYRQGHFANAVDWMQKVLAHAGDFSTRDVEAYMVLAMAHYRLNQDGDAGVALGKGVEIAERELRKLESGDLGAGWIDWIIAHALMREAKDLAGERTAAAPAQAKIPTPAKP
jgi:WD40 repeat protein/Flp pilus assembly protein TadD